MNRTKIKLLDYIIITFIVVVSLAGMFSWVFAQLPGEGLTISPPITELSLKEGESSVQTIRITNPTNKLIEVYPRVMNFGAKGEGGEPAFFEATDESAKFSLAKWIEITQSKIALTPEQVVEFKYRINVPKGAEPGGHYGVVFFATEPPKLEDDATKVSIGSMIGSLVMVKVPGQIIEKGFLEDFKTNKAFYTKNKVNLTTRISNLGNVHFKPKGKITIKSFSGKTIETLPFNEQNGNVLPNSTRKFENIWEKKGFLMGRFIADLDLVYGENEKSLQGKISFWIIPLWIIIIAVLILILILFLLWKWRKEKKQNFKGDGSGKKGFFGRGQGDYPKDDSGKIILR